MQTQPGARPESVLVLGGAGFIGRHVAAALHAGGHRVVIGSRVPASIDGRLPTALRRCERRQIRFEKLLTASDWDGPLAGTDLVVNSVGILRERGRETYERLHRLAPAALAAACRGNGVRLIHVSALGLNAPVKSRFLTSKLAGEQAIRASGADWQIVRPALLDGDGGFGAGWLRRMARWPVHPVPADAGGRIAVLDVRDLGEAVARLAGDPLRPDRPESEREFDLGGRHARTLAGHLAALRRLHTARPAWRLPVAAPLARLGSQLCDLLHFSPYSYGHWELLRRDNRPAWNRLPELLGRDPRPVGCELDAGAVPQVSGEASSPASPCA